MCSFHDKMRATINPPLLDPIPYVENDTQHYQEGVDKEENYLRQN